MARRFDSIFVNLPVNDLDESIAFFTELGFEFNPEYTDENATCMVLGDHLFIMLLTTEFMKQFTKKPIGSFDTETSVITALATSSKQEVDELYEKAIAAGAERGMEMNEGEMISKSFYDPNGHLFEIVYMPKI
ncbi:VOC family protein [Listeria aquatica]|uniref:Glyoxalase/bleomycin resistance/extradiol dioxygenase family protein n=1 Tax=Listeria aquatica TaxID=1494960 RepID=A0A841ZL32_9LIST|nr:VOC family protein [Listeria aquatica]MBC1520158.1 glyoxalase/bleomycin resistance/extradiol dioxygenase family protein [Listeria aquatica]